MPRTYYKLAGMGKLPPCAICAGSGQGPRAELQLTHGVRVWLCAYHRDPQFLTARAGRDLISSLHAVWRAAGCVTRSRSAALFAHQRRIQAAGRGPGRPGSYAWPALRREAEARFAKGDRPAQVMADLRRRCSAGEACAPALRTMRRWYAEGRWLPRERADDGAGPAPAQAAGAPGAAPATPADPSRHLPQRLGVGTLPSASHPVWPGRPRSPAAPSEPPASGAVDPAVTRPFAHDERASGRDPPPALA